MSKAISDDEFTIAGSTIENIVLNNISLVRQQKIILKQLNIALSSEHFILMTGQNGSGKSTLLKIMSGLLKPDSIIVNYQQQSLFSRFWFMQKQFLREHFCYLHQTPYLFSGSVYDNIAYGLKHKKISRQQQDYQVNQALKMVNLEHLSQRHSHALSGGERQRIAIARSWLIKPTFMLLDEPFANMDKHSRQTTYDILNQLKTENIGIIITSHDAHNGELDFNRHLHLYQAGMTENSI